MGYLFFGNRYFLSSKIKALDKVLWAELNRYRLNTHNVFVCIKMCPEQWRPVSQIIELAKMAAKTSHPLYAISVFISFRLVLHHAMFIFSLKIVRKKKLLISSETF